VTENIQQNTSGRVTGALAKTRTQYKSEFVMPSHKLRNNLWQRLQLCAESKYTLNKIFMWPLLATADTGVTICFSVH